jgi:hypothetical protein
VRSFSIKGIATKGFYGPNAKTIGAPNGYGSGNSSGPPTPTRVVNFVSVGGTTLGGGVIFIAVCICDASHWIVADANGNVARTANGGSSWITSTPFTNIVAFSAMANNGTTVIAYFQNATQGVVFRSIDSGATWTDVTPVAGMQPSEFIAWSPGIGAFTLYDGTNGFWGSPTGASGTWTNAASPTNGAFNFTPGTVVSVGANIITGGSDNTGGVIVHSTDGINYTTTFSSASETSVAGACFDGTDILITTGDNVGNGYVHRSYNSGGSFTLVQGPNADNVAPFGGGPIIGNAGVALCGFFLQGINPFELASTSNHGGSFTNTFATSGGLSYGSFLDYDGLFFNSFGPIFTFGNGAGIMSANPPFTSWQVALSLTSISAEVKAMAQGFGLTLACGRDDSNNGQVWKR